MIQIGNQTAFSASSVMAPFEYAVARGFDAFEWFPDKKPDGCGWDDRDLTAEIRAHIRKTAETRSIRLSVHARWTINPVIAETHAMLVREMDFAHELSAKVLVVHLSAGQGVAAFAEAIRPFGPLAASRGVQIAVENTVHTSPQDFNLLFQSKLDHIGMCLDVGHANLCAATRNDYLGFIDQLDESVPIIHLHVHENWGDADNHLTLFTGPAGQNDAGIRGVVKRMKGRGYSGSAVLEQWPQPPTLLDQARERLLAIWNEVNMDAQRQKTVTAADPAGKQPIKRGVTPVGRTATAL